MNPRVFSKCLKDGKQISGIFDLIYDKGQPAVAIGGVLLGEKTVAHVLTINPQWLRKVQNPDYQFEYDGLIVIPSAAKN